MNIKEVNKEIQRKFDNMVNVYNNYFMSLYDNLETYILEHKCKKCKHNREDLGIKYKNILIYCTKIKLVYEPGDNLIWHELEKLKDCDKFEEK